MENEKDSGLVDLLHKVIPLSLREEENDWKETTEISITSHCPQSGT